MSFKIYHIPGVKIGCSTNPEVRVKVQGFTNYEILEEHEDIYVASEREIELQKQYGYDVDRKQYHRVISMPTPEGVRLGGVNGGQIASSTGQIKRVSNHNNRHKFTDEQIIKGALIASNKESNPFKQNVKCPNCGVSGKLGPMKRWHFDNCKKR